MFKNTQVNDYAWSCILGAGKVYEYLQHDDKPIRVRFPDTIALYHVDGRRHTTDKYPELYHRRFDPPKNAFLPPVRSKHYWLYKNPAGEFRITRVPHATSAEVKDNFTSHGCTLIEPILSTKQKDKSMYLMIENNRIIKSNVCSESDKKDANNHYTLLIDISDPAKPKEYYNSEWHSVAGFERK